MPATGSTAKRERSRFTSMSFGDIITILKRLQIFTFFKEFGLLKESDAIYKLLGPTLLKQDSNEARTNVEKRIQFIQQEM